jgi:hypothetical protein
MTLSAFSILPSALNNQPSTFNSRACALYTATAAGFFFDFASVAMPAA